MSAISKTCCPCTRTPNNLPGGLNGRLDQNTLPVCSTQGRDRIGTATLELVMSMTVLLVLVVGIVWLGSSVIAQTEVTIEARHKTWQERSNANGTALLFLKDDLVSEEATKTVEVSPLFDDAESPESSHDVMRGVWDFDELKLDRAPNWKEFAIAAANAKTGSLQNGYVDARNKLTVFKNEARNIWQSIGVALVRQLTGLGDSIGSLFKGGESAVDAKASEARARIKGEISAKKQELSEAREKLRELDKDASDALKKVYRNRIKRLKSEVDDLQDDLKAIK